MTTLSTIDWNNIQAIIDSMKHQEESERTPDQDVAMFMEQAGQLISQGWPYQEIAMEDSASHEYIGIPIELAHAVLSIFKFCAEKNIDLGEAIRLVMTFRV